MITLYGYIILVDLALLAIVTAMFIFAVTIYRGASELCVKEEERASNRSKEMIAAKKVELSEKLKTLTNGISLDAVRAELDNLNDEIRNIDKSVQKTINKAKFLTARNMVFTPGSLLIVSIIGSGMAITIPDLQTMMWALSLVFLAIGLYFTCRNICAIEFFSNFIDLSTLMEKALANHAQKMKPVVDMKIWDFTLEIGHGETKKVEYHVFLKHGSIGKNAKVRFAATGELDFPKEETQPFNFNKENMINPKWFEHTLGDINPHANRVNDFKVKVPAQPGEYTMSYWLRCDEYTGDEVAFKIKVI